MNAHQRRKARRARDRRARDLAALEWRGVDRGVSDVAISLALRGLRTMSIIHDAARTLRMAVDDARGRYGAPSAAREPDGGVEPDKAGP